MSYVSDKYQGTRNSESDISLPTLVREAKRQIAEKMTDYSPRSYYSMDAMDERCQEMDKRQNKLSNDEGLQEALWQCDRINEFLAQFDGEVTPHDVELVYKGGSTYWHMNRNPSHVVRFKDIVMTQRNLFKKNTKKGEQGEFYWVFTHRM